MIATLAQNLIHLSFKNSSPPRKFDAVFCLPLQRFSTSGEAQSGLHPTVYEFLVQDYHFSPKSALEIASAVARFRGPKRSGEVLSFLKESGFSNSQLEKTLKGRPQLLSSNLERYVKPKIMIFQDMGISATDTAEIISKNPLIIKCSLNNRIIPAFSLLKKLMGPANLAPLLKASPWFLLYDLGQTLVPNFELLNKCGVPKDLIIWMMYHCPRFLLCKHGDMMKFVERADAMGVPRTSRMFGYAVKAMNSVPEGAWKMKLRYLREVVGFSDDDIMTAFRKCPNMFTLSETRIKEAKDALLASGKYDVSCMVRNPVVFTYSVEKRHRPRLRVLGLLEGKNLIRRWPSVLELCNMTDQRFYEKYVAPFRNQLGDVFVVKLKKNSS